MPEASAQPTTVYRVLANRPGNPGFPVYVGPDPLKAVLAYDAEPHAFFATQEGTFDAGLRPISVRTVASAYK